MVDLGPERQVFMNRLDTYFLKLTAISGGTLSNHCVAALPKYNLLRKLVIMLYDCEENREARLPLMIRGMYSSNLQGWLKKRGG
jgi:hypothetical protein